MVWEGTWNIPRSLRANFNVNLLPSTHDPMFTKRQMIFWVPINKRVKIHEQLANSGMGVKGVVGLGVAEVSHPV